MRRLVSALMLSVCAAAAGAEEITMIDARGLSVETLLRMAAEARAHAGPLDCCDWGGGCLADKTPRSAESGAGQGHRAASGQTQAD